GPSNMPHLPLPHWFITRVMNHRTKEPVKRSIGTPALPHTPHPHREVAHTVTSEGRKAPPGDRMCYLGEGWGPYGRAGHGARGHQPTGAGRGSGPAPRRARHRRAPTTPTRGSTYGHVRGPESASW